MKREAIILLIVTFFLIGLSFVINMAVFAFQAWREKRKRDKKAIEELTKPKDEQ